MPDFTHSDRRLLRAILAQGHVLEKAWPVDTAKASATPAWPTGLVRDRSAVLTRELEALRRLMAQADGATAPGLRRLALHVRDLTIEMSARHLAAILVPFERLQSRALRDDEFLVTQTDGPRGGATMTDSTSYIGGTTHEESVSPTRGGASAGPAVARGRLVAVADNLRSAFNVGAILRTSEALGAESAVLAGYTPTPDHEKTARTSMGTHEVLPWRSAPRAAEAIADLKARGFTIVALETSERAVDLEDFTWPENCAIVVGNERFGLDHDVLASADQVVRIPLYGQKNSLNVGIAFGIAANAWRAARARDAKLRPTAMPRTHLLSAIGTFHGPARFPYEARRQGAVADDAVSSIELAPGQDFEQALRGVEGFSRLWLLYQFDRNANWKPMVMPPRGPRVKRGVFATRSPHRPNALGLSAVELVAVDGRRVFVRGCDLLDGTPIFDIKPYLPYADAFPEATAGWTEKLDGARNAIHFSARAESQLAWLEENGVTQLRGFVVSQLEFDPLDHERKRVERRMEEENETTRALRGRLAYRTWRVDFRCESAHATSGGHVTIESIRSGYTPDELLGRNDPYGDKILHRAYAAVTP